MSSVALQEIGQKIRAGIRLSQEDGEALFRSGDLRAIGALANEVRERRHGDVTYFNRNLHINATNVCDAT